MGMEWVFINNGPVTGNAPPGSIGIDLLTPQIEICGSNGIWTGASGLAGLQAQITAAATITPTAAMAHITGAIVVETITPPSGLRSGATFTLIPDDASGQATGVTGNIALASTLVQKKALILTWDATAVKWYPSY
jgi:hypothetical protein